MKLNMFFTFVTALVPKQSFPSIHLRVEISSNYGQTQKVLNLFEELKKIPQKSNLTSDLFTFMKSNRIVFRGHIRNSNFKVDGEILIYKHHKPQNPLYYSLEKKELYTTDDEVTFEVVPWNGKITNELETTKDSSHIFKIYANATDDQYGGLIIEYLLIK